MPYVLKLDFASLMMWPEDWRRQPEYRKRYEELLRRVKNAGSRKVK